MALDPINSDYSNEPSPLIKPKVNELGGTLPQVPQGNSLPQTLQPLVKTPRMQREEQLQQKISQFENPNKPQGFWQNLAHVASKVGNIAGDIAIPSVMANLPGTDYNNALQHQNRVQQLTELQARDAQDSADTTETALKQAQTGEAQAKTKALQNPTDKPDAVEFQQTDHGLMRINKTTGEAQPVTYQGQPLQPRETVQKPGTKTVQLQINGKPHQVLIDDNTGKQVADLGESGEKPQTINVNAGNAALDREIKQYGGSHQKSVDAANTQLEKIEDARGMINGSAEAQALGIPKVLTALVSGAGTGVRITQAELNSIAKARGLQGDVEGTLNSLAGKGKLSNEQKQQITGLLDDVKGRIQKKQQIANDTLDTINNAGSREQIIKADNDARHKLSQMETGAGNVSVKAPNGKTYPFPDQASADRFKKEAGIK